jgi:hypothetical protein
MSDMIGSGSKWLAGKVAAANGRDYVYRRGPTEQSFRAVPGKLLAEVDLGSGVAELVKFTMFTVTRDEIPAGEPQRGDRIVEQIGTTSVEFEVAGPKGLPLFTWGDFRESITIRTVEVVRPLDGA